MKAAEDVQFWVTLIKVVPEEQRDTALECLRKNCTWIEKGFYIFEGDTDALRDWSVENWEELTTGAVPGLGDLNTRELKEVCLEHLGWDDWEM